MPKILIVDDEKNVLKTLSIGLKRHKFLVEQALNGQDALQLLKDDQFDFVLSDIRMHPMDGYTLAAKIRKKYPALPVILMSAYGFEDQTVEEKDGVLYPKLTKPFTVNQLLDKLQDVKDNWRQNPEDTKQSVLLLCEPDEQKAFTPILLEAGLVVCDINMNRDIKPQIIKTNIDFILIDHALLENDRWKLLNELDQAAPSIPVLILVDRIHGKEHLQTKDLSITFVDRDKVLKDPKWIANRLNALVH